MAANPYAKYKQQSIMTMTQGEMLIQLYAGISKQLAIAVEAIEKDDIITANTALQKSQKIINYLKVTLKSGYEVSGQLNSLYDYFIECIIRANVKKDAQPIKEIMPFIQELQDTFTQAEKLVHMK